MTCHSPGSLLTIPFCCLAGSVSFFNPWNFNILQQPVTICSLVFKKFSQIFWVIPLELFSPPQQSPDLYFLPILCSWAPDCISNYRLDFTTWVSKLVSGRTPYASSSPSPCPPCSLCHGNGKFSSLHLIPGSGSWLVSFFDPQGSVSHSVLPIGPPKHLTNASIPFQAPYIILCYPLPLLTLVLSCSVLLTLVLFAL